MKPIKTALLALPLLAAGCNRDSGTAKIRPLEAGSVRVEDAFWGPRYEKWEHVTVGDMLNKFEGNDPAHFACGVDAFENFDLVASGARDIGRHAGPPWYDGLVYETIRGISDLLAQRPDPALKARVDGYIARIEAAQKSDPDGFVGTNTQLTEDNHRWGANGGFLRMQHDVYNAGMLIEAGVHYYEATGDDRLLKVATRMADYMVRTMGPAPKKNIVPAHSGPEEALVKLYKLYRDRPGLRAQPGRSPQPATISGWPSSGSATAACTAAIRCGARGATTARSGGSTRSSTPRNSAPKHGPHGAITRRTRSAYSTSPPSSGTP